AHTLMTFTVTIDHSAKIGPRDVSVTNPAPGGDKVIISDGFVVGAPVPTADQFTPVYPTEIHRGETANFYVSGSGYVGNWTIVRYPSGPDVTAGTPNVTSPDGRYLSVQLSASTTAELGSHPLEIYNPGPGGGRVQISLNVVEAAPTI